MIERRRAKYISSSMNCGKKREKVQGMNNLKLLIAVYICFYGSHNDLTIITTESTKGVRIPVEPTTYHDAQMEKRILSICVIAL